MVLNAGITNVMNLLAGDAAGKKFTKIAVGTSGAAVTGSETALTGQVAKNIDTFNELPGGFIQFNATLLAGDPAMTIREMGLINEAGTLCYRQVITPVTKVAGATYTLTYKIQIK